MNDRTLPALGAAMPVAELEHHHAWLLEAPRDLEIQDPFFPGVIDGDWRPVIRRARELLAGHAGRLGIHAPFDGLQLASTDPAVRGLVARRYAQALEFAGELGATHMVIHSPFQFFGHPQVAHAPGPGLDAQIGRAHATLEQIVPAAERQGCTLVVENTLDTNPTALLALVRSFGSERVRASVDTGHAFITHRTGGPTPDQWVRQAGPLLEHVHIQDNDGQLDRHWAPGDGGINWRAVFAALAELAHPPRLIIEVADRARDIRRGAAFLTGLGLAS